MFILRPVGIQCKTKRIILGALLVRMFDVLAIHCTKLGNVVSKFNSDLQYKSFVFVDEG